MHEISTALELYYADHNAYPALIDGSGTGGADGPDWTGTACIQDSNPTCEAWADTNWTNVINILVSGQYLARAEEMDSESQKQQEWATTLAENILTSLSLFLKQKLLLRPTRILRILRNVTFT